MAVAKMGVIDNEMKKLQDVVSGLEDRVRRLEQRQSGESITSESVRMILMGPPGAGMLRKSRYMGPNLPPP